MHYSTWALLVMFVRINNLVSYSLFWERWLFVAEISTKYFQVWHFHKGSIIAWAAFFKQILMYDIIKDIFKSSHFGGFEIFG